MARPESVVGTSKRRLGPALVAAAAAVLLAPLPGQARPAARSALSGVQRQQRAVKAPEFSGAVGWLNTDRPLRLSDLRGKIVLLDFWTFCCVNCMHVMPDLAKLEKKYPNELVVIGVHSAKFQNEKGADAIRKAILRYQIAHPVINDANLAIWKAYHVQSWPTMVLIDPRGYIVYHWGGEGQLETLDRAIGTLIQKYKGRGLNTRPLKTHRAASDAAGPLNFPGKVLADEAGKRLFIADSTNHRIVITDLAGKKIAVAGGGEWGWKDGDFESARFNDPQGMALKGGTLYVADRKNHMIRALDLEKKTVTTVAGTGVQGYDRAADGPARKIGLNSPWDLLLDGDRLFIAMAGIHQIWVMDTAKETVAAYAGSGREEIIDGTLANSAFAQPSGLASDGRTLWVADAETSSIRAVAIAGRGGVQTVLGEGLFVFGDVDGPANKARLQHALGVVYHDGKLYVADTYNSKIKVVDPVARTSKTLAGEKKGWLATRTFNEPAGISYAGGKLYVADTNAHRIRTVDLKTGEVATLKLEGVTAPKAADR